MNSRFKINKVFNKTAVRLHFYNKKIDELKFITTNEGQKSEHVYNTLIPNEEIQSNNIIVYLDSKQKGIIEIDLIKYKKKFPLDGLFLCIECLSYFDENNLKLERDYKPTQIEAHLTTSNNYCVKHKLFNIGWINQNDRVKIDFELVFKNKESKKSLIAPTFGLKAIKIME